MRYRLFLFTMALLTASCSRPVSEVVVGDIEDQGYYRNHTGSRQVSEQIEASFQSVKMIQTTVFYQTYHFDPENLPSRSQLNNVSLIDVAVSTSSDNHSKVGTAVALSEFQNRYMLLTAAHIVSAPDTLWHQVSGASAEDQMIEAVSVVNRKNYLLFGVGTVVPFEVKINDGIRDLALIATLPESGSLSDIQPLSIPSGNTSELGWADMVYTTGFPKGTRMVNLGIVSRTDRSRNGFTIDASFNRGYSGGVVFAVSGSQPNLEWVGILSSVSAEVEYILTPEDMTIEDYQPDIPYTDSAFVDRKTRINYGIGHAIGLNEIQNFFRENRAAINESGFPTPTFQ